MWRCYRKVSLFLLIGWILIALDVAWAQPNISNLNPNSGMAGETVVITGVGFGATQGSSTVAFNGVSATPTEWSDTTIIVSAPNGAASGQVVVTVSSIVSNGILFTMADESAIYLYDPLGRLVRAINKTTGEVSIYSYDAVGNLLAIMPESGGNFGAPAITGITPSSIRAGERWDMVITGTHLLGGSVQTSNTGIKVLSQKATDTSVTASFLAAVDALVGLTAVLVTTPLGQAGTTINVNPPLLSLLPSTLAVNKGQTATITATLASAQSVATTIDFIFKNPGVAMAPASLTILTGELSAVSHVTGVNRGFTDISAQIRGTAATAGSISVTVYDPQSPAGLTTIPVSVHYPHLGKTATGGQVTPPVSVVFAHLGTTATGGQVTPPVSVVFAHLAELPPFFESSFCVKSLSVEVFMCFVV